MTNELSLGSSGVRADMAILSDEFIGVEIKSAGDTLRRLENQLSAYSSYFERVILIVADRHLKGIDEKWLNGAALWRITVEGEVIEIVSGSRNTPSVEAYEDLLTKSEKRRFWLPSSGIDNQLESARETFISVFRRRYGRTSQVFWDRVRGRPIRVADLTVLSRFSVIRESQRRHEDEREEFWRLWTQQNEAGDS